MIFLFTIIRDGGHCNHIAGLLYTLNHWFLLGITEIPADKTCTSLPQMWHQPRGGRIVAEPIMNCVFANSSADRAGTRKKLPVTCKLYDARSKILKSEGWRRETVLRMCSEMNKREKKPPCSYLLADQEAPANVNTVFGNVPIGSILSYQLKDLKEDAVLFSIDRPPDQVVATGNEIILSFPDLPSALCTATPFAPPHNLPTDQSQFLSKLNLNLETARQVEKKTVKQSVDPEWFALRKLRLTASNFGLVVNRKKQPTEVFLRNIFQPKDLSNVASIKHGKQNESIARTLYAHEMQKRNTKFTVYEAGLVINPSLPYLGASPDGKVFDPTDKEPFGLLEIKAPFAWRNSSSLEACQDSNFMCHVVDGKPQLKVNHKSGYYAQIQGQLALSGLPWCDFVVFLTGSRNIHVQRIYFDVLYWGQELLPKLHAFYFNYALPYLHRLECVAVSSCSDAEMVVECYSHN